MEAMKLNDQERRVYSNLFNHYDIENSGKLPIRNVTDLFGMSGLSAELLHQIVDLSGAKRAGYFNKVQFYIALKLIAAAQSGLPLTLESLTAASELPLPIFNRLTEAEPRSLQQQKIMHNYTTITDNRGDLSMQIANVVQPDQRTVYVPQHSSQVTQPLPPPPTVQRRASRSNPTVDIRSAHRVGMRSDEMSQSFTDTISPPMSPQYSAVLPPQSPLSLAHSQPYASYKPSHIPYTVPPAPPAPHQYGMDTSYNSSMVYGSVSIAQHPVMVQQQPPMVVHPIQNIVQQPVTAVHVNQQVTTLHAGQASLSQPSQNVTKNQWHGSIPNDGTHSPQSEKSWAMFDDDSQGLISLERKDGSHFADTKADTSSMSSEAESVDDVWTINDEQRDYYVNQFLKLQPDLQGMVSGSIAKEFFEKSKLPIAELSKIWSLADINQDGALTLDEFCIAMHLVVLRRNGIDLPSHLPRSLMPYDKLPNDQETNSQDSTLKRSPLSSQTDQQQWSATFTAIESPSSSSISTSPGSKPTPANFEFKPIVVDPDRKIVQPLPVRLSPDHLNYHNSDRDSGDAEEFDDVDARPHLMAPDQLSVHSEQLIDFESDVGLPIVNKTANSQLSSGLQSDTNEESSSEQKSLSMLPTSEAIRPVTLPGLSRWNGVKEATDTTALLQSSSKQSVSTASSEVYLSQIGRSKAAYESIAKSKTSITSEDNSDIVSLGHAFIRPHDKRSLKQAIRNQKEKNMILSRLNSELNQELQELMEQRIALEIQLEHLRPFSS